MNIFYKAYARSYQKILFIAMHFLPFKEPKLIKGEGSIKGVYDILKENKLSSCLIVTDNVLFSMGMLDGLIASLTEKQIKFQVYHDVVPNPTIKNIEEAVRIYKENSLEAIVAFGGGSSMDAAKGVGARVSNINKTIPQLKGILKIKNKLPLLIAIPTTAGTGSEATVAAVISNPDKKEKYAINDPKLIPSYAVLDPTLLVGLPGKVTSTVGMDAFAHAIEAYIGKSNTKKTRLYARKAIKLIYENLIKSFNDPKNLSYRSNMQMGAYLAGVSFTKAYVGYVHSISHSFGALYNTPHGLAISIVLPNVLEEYGSSVNKKLAELTDLLGLGMNISSIETKAKIFIDLIKDMNKQMGIPSRLENVILDKDIPLLVEHAIKEANPLYPVPKILGKKEIIDIINKIK